MSGDHQLVWEPAAVRRFAEQLQASRAAIEPARAALQAAARLVLARGDAVAAAAAHHDAHDAVRAMTVGIDDDARVLHAAARTSEATERALVAVTHAGARQHVVAVALGQVGEPWRAEYADGQPPAPTLWCGEFVSWAYAHAGHPLPAVQTPGASGFASVPAMVDWVQAHAPQQWHTGAADVRLGDIVVVDDEGHVALALGPAHDGAVPTVDGNWAGHVARTSHATSTVVGVWRPLS
ncbi:MAG TPA: hypothetical protein VHE83_16065 [Mycobacteriales bacterium]|nr:hypothetical protein [Mycobacteriales bacterium]